MEVVKMRGGLTRDLCVAMVDAISEFCKTMRIHKTDSLRTCLSAEDCLNYWLDHGFEGSTVTLRVGMKMLTPVVTLEMEGDACSPVMEGADEVGLYVFNLQVRLNMRPEYSYARNKTEEAVVLGLTIDLFLDFLSTAVTATITPLQLVNTASDLNMLDREVLKSVE